MNKAPKKIWYASNPHNPASSNQHGDATQYIRADLVNELASLLKEWLENEDNDKDWMNYEDRITAALNAMEEE